MGKVFVCSDIHSHLDVFDRAMNDLDSGDEMYIIGDVADKGPDGLAVLERIMDDQRCHMLMGNHDLMFLQYLTLHKNLRTRYSEDFRDIEFVWLYRNAGLATWDSFQKLDESRKEAMENYLKDLPVLLNIRVGDRVFMLVHAYPVNHGTSPVQINELRTGKGYNWRSDYVWARHPFHHEEGKIIITGHTSVFQFGSKSIVHDEAWYDIDCGLAFRCRDSRLGVLCLNDLSERYYVPEIL